MFKLDNHPDEVNLKVLIVNDLVDKRNTLLVRLQTCTPKPNEYSFTEHWSYIEKLAMSDGLVYLFDKIDDGELFLWFISPMYHEY